MPLSVDYYNIPYGRDELTTAEKAIFDRNSDLRFVCLILTYAAAGTIISHVFRRGTERSQLKLFVYLPAILILLPIVYDSVALRIVYFGLPTIFTFGTQIGNTLPSSCEASMSVEGPDGWPCFLARLRTATMTLFRDHTTASLADIFVVLQPVLIKTVILLFLTTMLLVIAVTLHVMIVRDGIEMPAEESQSDSEVEKGQREK